MPRSRPGRTNGATGFAVYVEGPRDHEILLAWATRLSRPLGRSLPRVTVILGGRQPARAVQHLRQLRATHPDATGICILDRDANRSGSEAPPDEPGLEFYTWQRRHIESYLLVPDAIRRGMRLSEADSRAHLLRRLLPDPADLETLATLDAKRFLARDGQLAQELGRPASPGRIARAMRVEELDPEVRTLLGRLMLPLGIDSGRPAVIRRKGGPERSPGTSGILPTGH